MHQYRVRTNQLESRSAGKELGCWWTSLPGASNAPFQNGKWHPGLRLAEHCQQVKGGDPSLQLSTGEDSSGVLSPVVAFPVQERYGFARASPVQG